MNKIIKIESGKFIAGEWEKVHIHLSDIILYPTIT